MQGAARPRGVALAIAGQATFVGAWLLGVVGAIGGSELGLLAALGGLVALVLTTVALFLMRPWLGGLAPAAAWVLIGGLALGAVLFIAIPGGREWGKLGAFIIAIAALALALAVAHLLLALALWRASAPRPAACGRILAACGRRSEPRWLQGAVPPTSEVYGGYSAARRGHGDAADARRSHFPRTLLGVIAAACEVLAIVAVGVIAAGGEEPAGFLALGASVAAHALLLVALTR